MNTRIEISIRNIRTVTDLSRLGEVVRKEGYSGLATKEQAWSIPGYDRTTITHELTKINWTIWHDTSVPIGSKVAVWKWS